MSNEQPISSRAWADDRAVSDPAPARAASTEDKPGRSDAKSRAATAKRSGRLADAMPETGNRKLDGRLRKTAGRVQGIAKVASKASRLAAPAKQPSGAKPGGAAAGASDAVSDAAPKAKGPLSSVLGDAGMPDGVGISDIRQGLDAIAAGDLEAANKAVAQTGAKIVGASVAGPVGAVVGGKLGDALADRGLTSGLGPVGKFQQQAAERALKRVGAVLELRDRAKKGKWVALGVVLALVMVILLGGQAAAPSPSAINPPSELADQNIPGDYFDAYVDAVRFASEPIPWSLVAGVGSVATDHGRRSPYDNVDRTVDPNTISPEVTPPITGPGNGPLLLVVDPNPPQDEPTGSGNPDPTPSTTIPHPPTSVLGGGRPKSTTTTTPRATPTTGSGSTPTSLRMVPIANVTPTTTSQSAVLPERGVNPNDVDVQSIGESAEYLAHLMADYGEELAAEKGLDIDELAQNALEDKDSAQFWVEVLSKMPISLGSGDAASCTAPPGTPVPVVISIVWRCEGAKVLDKLQIVVGLGEPKYVPGTPSTPAHSEPGPEVVVTGQAALNQLVQEALDASYLYSSWGAAPCDPKSATGGVFPISPANRCDVVTNITAAAQAVMSRESTPIASRGSSTIAHADYGWSAMPSLLGHDGFLQNGFPPSTNLNDACESVVINASYRMPSDGPWSNYDPSDRSHDADLEQQWQSSAINQSGQSSVRCGPYVTSDPTWRHAVAETLLSTASTSDDGADVTTTTQPGAASSSTTSTTMRPPAKNANLSGLAQWLARDPLTVSPQFGTTSIVNRLSNPKVLVTAPSLPPVGQDYFAHQVIRVAAAYLDLPSPFPEDANFGIAGVPPVAADAYRHAAALAPHVESACRISVSLIAAVGQVETNHGQGAGSTIVANGILSPPIIGPAMNGSGGQPSVTDTDGGTYDKDAQWDHEVGLMRTRPSVFNANRIDANNDTVYDPQNVYDSASTLAVTLCRAQKGKALTTTSEIRAALTVYRNDKAYVDKVMAAMAQYQAAGADGGAAAGATPVQGGDPNLCLVKTHGIVVNCSIGQQTGDLIDAAARDGFSLSGWGWRSYDSQVALRKAHCGSSDYDVYEKPSSECHPPTARPGHSQHEVGLAIDFTYQGSTISSHSSPAWQWLSSNAARYGFYNLPSEPWHWSTTGN